MTLRIRKVARTICNSRRVECGCFTRSFSHVTEMINEGGLREINAFSINKHRLNPAEFKEVMHAYSLSASVQFSMSKLSMPQLRSIHSETLERMLATSLLCNYKGIASVLAKEAFQRGNFSLGAYGHCLIAFSQDEKWEYLDEHAHSDVMLDFTLASELMTTYHFEVIDIVLLYWIKKENVANISDYIEGLYTSVSDCDTVLAKSPATFSKAFELLRYHGKDDLCDRLLTLCLFKIRQKCFSFLGMKQSKVNEIIDDLSSFSTVLNRPRDTKYLQSLYSFFLKKIIPSRLSYSRQMLDIEKMLSAWSKVLLETENASCVALSGYDLYARLVRIHKYRTFSPGVLTEVAKIIGYLDQKNFIAANKRHDTTIFSKAKGLDLRLLQLNRVKRDFVNSFNHSKRVTPHNQFFSAYLQSTLIILKSKNKKILLSKRKPILDELMAVIRKSGLAFGKTVEFSNAVVSIFLCEMEMPVLRKHMLELVEYVSHNQDCLSLTTISMMVLREICDRNNFAARFPLEGSPTSPSADEDNSYCLWAADHIHMFLQHLSRDGHIEQLWLQDHACMGTIRMGYQSYHRSSEREWFTMKLLQASIVQLLNLNNPIVMPVLTALVFDLSKLQIVPYSYWSQAIRLCDRGMMWKELTFIFEILLQQGKLIQTSDVHSVVTAYMNIDKPEISFRVIKAMLQEGIFISLNTYRALCISLEEKSNQSRSKECSKLAEKTFKLLCESHGPVPFKKGSFNEIDYELLHCRSQWCIRSDKDELVKRHLRECRDYIENRADIQAIYEEALSVLPSRLFESGAFVMTTMLSMRLGVPSDSDVDRFIDAAIANDRSVLASSILHSISQLKKEYFEEKGDEEEGEY